MSGISLFFAALFSAVLAWAVWDSNERDLGKEEGQRYTPFLGSICMPVLLLILLIFSSFTYSVTESLRLIASTFFGTFLHIGFYNLLLLALVPLLRRKISARACGYLWMLPNLLYLSQAEFLSPDHPLWIIHVPDLLLSVLTGIWISGFCGVLLYQLLSHLIFRHRILKSAVRVQDSEILELWKQEQEQAGIVKPTYKLLYSPAVRTPLSIGLWKHSVRVILPHTDYSREELHLIFRHELIHICREDAWSKFSLMFCTAVCWFNPFMWISMRKSFDDLELSCDETVLLHATDGERRQYAELLLKTAGQEQGFTTCLSATASALRYRMKNSIRPRKLHSGALTVGILSFLLLTTCGSVALSYGSQTGKDVVFFGQEPESYVLTTVRDTDHPSYRDYLCPDPEPLGEYLASLPFRKLTGHYDFMENDRSLILLFDTPNGTLGLDLEDTTVNITKFWGKEITQERFLVPGGLDWDFLDTVILKMPAVNLHLTGPRDSDTSYGSMESVTQVSDGKRKILLDSALSDDSITGIYGNIDYDTMTLSFPEPPISPVKLTISSWDRTESETIILSFPAEVIPLSGNSSHFTISASFAGPNGSTYEMVFRFELQYEG